MNPSLRLACAFLATATLLAASSAPALAALVDRFGPPTWQVGGDQPAALLGFSATTAGDVNGDGYSDVIVGAPLEDSTFTDEGAADLYLGSANGSALTPSWVYRGRQAGAGAGTAVAPAGDVNGDGYEDVLIAVPAWDTPANADAGKVVVFHGGPNGLSSTPAYELFSPAPAAGQRFGVSVAPAGDVNGDGYADVLVGSQFSDGGFVRGAAYLFEGGVGGLFLTPAKTWLGQAGADTQLGRSLSTAGDVNADGFADVIIGAPGEVNPLVGAGSAYVYLGSASGIVAAPDTVIKGTAANVHCGQSVSVGGDVNGDGFSDVLIGVPQQGTNFPGKAMIGFGGPQGITTVADLPNPDTDANEFTGNIVSTLGDINGDGLADFGVVSRYAAVTGRGRVSVYLGARTGPEYFGEILTHGSDGFFGNCLATTGDTDGDGVSEVLVGTEDVSVQPGQHEGVAYQFKAPRNGLRLAAGGWPRLGGDTGTGYGSAVAVVPRFDGVVTDKLIIGDPQFGGVGRVSVHIGSQSTGVEFNEAASYPAGGPFWSYGARIVDAGDTDGDSYCDYAVSATTVDAGPENQVGMVLLHRGGPGAPPAPITIVTGVHAFDRVGSALAGRGDVNRDGYQDLLIGAREWDEPGKPDCGKIFLYFGSATGLLATPPWTRVGDVAGQGLGAGVALADLDGDGYTDVIAGSSSPTFGSTAPGKVEVYYGSASGPENTPGMVYLPPPPGEVSFGLTVANVGDVSGDGIADLGIGAPRENNRGVVRIFPGSLGRSQSPPFATILGTQDNARLGEAIAGGGDVDGDRVDDLAIGEPGWDGGMTDEGRFSLYYGSPKTHGLVPGPVILSGILGAALGASIAPFRDINLDGFADVIAGAPGAAGRVYPFMGGGGFGMRNEIDPYDYGPSNHRAVHPALSHDPDQVAAAFYEHTAAQGRSKIGFEIEIKPLNQPFDAVRTNWVGPTTFDSGPAGSQSFVFTTSFLSPDLQGPLKLRGRWVTPNPLFPRSRWVTPEAHTSGDHDVWVTGTTTGVPPADAAAGRLRIDAVAPNPSLGRGLSAVSFTLPRPGRVALEVFDLRGARVRALLDQPYPAGRSSIDWDGKDDHGKVAPAGVYLALLRSGNGIARAKVVRLP